MNATEFADFLESSRVLFSEVNRRFCDADPASEDARLAVWQEALSQTPAEDAKRCLDAIVGGEVDGLRYPADWDRYPGVVRRWCRENRPPKLTATSYAEELRVRCWRCCDSGWATLLNVDWLQHEWDRIAAGEWPADWHQAARCWRRSHRTWLTAAFRCPCSGHDSPRGPVLRMGGMRGIRTAAEEYVASHDPTDAYAWTP